MFGNSTSKVYGLSFPTRKSDVSEKKRIESVFSMEDSDEENAEEQLKLKPRVAQPDRVQQAKIHRKTKSDYEKALEEDPSVFQYDEIYDEIKNEKERHMDSLLTKKEKQSKYVDRLLKTANERKLERELCQERKAQKEIEAEADLYGDKESFVTSAYKNKLTELRELVAKREAEQFVEKHMDITTQDGLGGFYRYMYDHGLGGSREDNPVTKESKKNDGEPAPKESRRSRHKSPSRSPKCESSKPVREQDENPSSNLERSEHRSTSSRSERTDHKRTQSLFSEATRKSDPMDTRVSEHSTIDDSNEPAASSSEPKVKRSDPNFIYAKPRVTTDAELEEVKQRYLQRRAEGIHAVIAESDSDTE